MSPDAIVSLAQAKTQLNITSDQFNDQVQQVIRAAEEAVDGERGALNSSVKESTWVMHLDEFPEDGVDVKLPYGPVRAITSIEYDNDQGLTDTLTGWHLRRNGRESYAKRWDGWPSDVKEKPTTEPIRITYTAGYDTIPARIKQVVLAMVLDMFDNKAARGEKPSVATMWVRTALSSYRY